MIGELNKNERKLTEMFIEQDRLITKTYYIGDLMYIDIVDNGTNYEAWIYHIEYGIKSHMFGIAKHSNKPDGKVMQYEDFIQIVRQNMPAYKSSYESEYVD